MSAGSRLFSSSRDSSARQRGAMFFEATRENRDQEWVIWEDDHSAKRECGGAQRRMKRNPCIVEDAPCASFLWSCDGRTSTIEHRLKDHSVTAEFLQADPSKHKKMCGNDSDAISRPILCTLSLSLSPSLQIPHKRYDEKSNSRLLCRTITHERMYKRSCHCTGGRTKTQSCMIYLIFKVRKMVANLYRESLNATFLTHPGSSE